MKNIATLRTLLFLILLHSYSMVNARDLRTETESFILDWIYSQHQVLRKTQRDPATKDNFISIVLIQEQLDSISKHCKHPFAKHIFKSIRNVTTFKDTSAITATILINTWETELRRLEGLYLKGTNNRNQENFVAQKELEKLQKQWNSQYLPLKVDLIDMNELLLSHINQEIPPISSNNVILFCTSFQAWIGNMQGVLQKLQQSELGTKTVSAVLLQQNKKLLLETELIPQKAIDKLIQTIEINIQNSATIAALTEQAINVLETMRANHKLMLSLYDSYKLKGFLIPKTQSAELIKQWLISSIQP